MSVERLSACFQTLSHSLRALFLGGLLVTAGTAFHIRRAWAAPAVDPCAQFGLLTSNHSLAALATFRSTIDNQWTMNLKADRMGAFEIFPRSAWPDVLAVGIFITVLGIRFAGSRRRQRARSLRDQIEHRQDLLEAERYVREIVDSVPLWLLVLTHDLHIQSANRTFLNYFGLRQEEVQGRPLGDIIRTEDLPHRETETSNSRATTRDVLLHATFRSHEASLPARIALVDLVRVMEGKSELLLVVEDLTESERLRVANQAQERALCESEVRYRDFLECTEDFVGTHDLSGRILSASLAVARRAGFKSSEDLLGRNIADFLPPDRRGQFQEYLDTLRREGRAEGLMKAVTKEGEELILDYKNSLRREGAEGPVVLCVGREVTDRVRAQAALKQAQQFQASVIESVTNGIVVLDLEGHFTFVSRRVAEITGYEVGELTGRAYAAILLPEDCGKFGAALSQASKEGVSVSARRTRIVRKDGGRRTLIFNIAPLYVGKTIAGAVGSAEDVTELENRERALRSSEVRLGAMVGSIDEVVMEFDRDGTYLNIWAADESLLIRPRLELIGRRITDFLGSDLARTSLEAFQRVLETGRPESIEYPLEVLAGRRWFLGRLSPVPDADGVYRTICGLSRDITTRKNAEEELRASEQRYRMLFERNLAGVFRTTPEGKILDCNDAFARLLGYASREEVMKRSAWDMYPSRADRTLLLERLRQARTLTNHESELHCRDGRRVWVLENSTWIEDVDGSVVIEGTLIDFTKLRSAGAARRSPRLAGAEARLAVLPPLSPPGQTSAGKPAAGDPPKGRRKERPHPESSRRASENGGNVD